MRLEKWYADVVDGGVASILYRAKLEIGPARLGYARCIRSDGTTCSAFKLGGELPRMEGHRLDWPGTNARRWHGCSDRNHTLWEDGTRSLSWNPVVLNGVVEGAGLSAGARGYAERLVMNFGPWRLDLTSLKWGRFCGSSQSLIWIEWQGKIPKRLALLNGSDCGFQSASMRHVSCLGAVLQIAEPRRLVREPISAAARALSPMFVNPAVLRFLSGVEVKWLATATLDVPGGVRDTGFAIFEEVVWRG